MSFEVYLEIGERRVFAVALAWPGWARAGRDEESALAALFAAGPRYGDVVGAQFGFSPPARPDELNVFERVAGTTTTDFGAPDAILNADWEAPPAAELDRQVAILEACWAAFDRTARAAQGRELRKGPRGGGRDVDVMTQHVVEADRAYLSALGGRYDKPRGAAVDVAAMRAAFVSALRARASGELPEYSPRGRRHWPAPYAIRRSGWHAVDHVWEIEDRSHD